jgi:Carboxypeptidase regulatory-like domain
VKRAILIAVVVLSAYARPSFAQRGSITGVVVTSPGGEPASGATVRLVDEPPSTSPAGRQAQSTTTGGDGSFRFDDVEPAAYWIVANMQGFLPGEYGQRSATGTGISFAVAAGQRVNVTIGMWPTAGISGRVVDADGDPVGRVQVLALRTIYRDGRMAMTIAQTVMTDDRGEYRMFWLTPGSYRVAARQWDAGTSAPAVNIGPPRRFATNEQGTSPVVTRRRLANGSVVEETDVPVYAPSTVDPQLAVALTLGPGDNAAAVDIQFAGNRVPSHHVRGIVVRSVDVARLPFGPQLLMVPRAPSPFAIVAPGNAAPDGSFDIAGVAPGSYFLYAQDSSAMLPIEVGDADVENVTLTQSPGIALKGRLSFDRGLSPAATAIPNPSDFQIQMTREPYLVGAPDGGPRFNPAPAENGAISLNAVAPGDYRIGVRPYGIGPDGEAMATGRQATSAFVNTYMKSARLGETDVLASGLHLYGPTSQSLEIVIGLNGAEVQGSASENGRDPAANVVVVAVPDGANRGRADLYKRTSTDRQGRFAMAGLAPGDYTFYAWDDLERGAWESPEFMRAFEGRGRFVRLREGKNDPLELNVLVGR